MDLDFAHMASAILGSCSVAEVEDNLATVSYPIAHDLWHDLRSAGLIRDEAPTL
jgi:hypothetical protein